MKNIKNTELNDKYITENSEQSIAYDITQLEWYERKSEIKRKLELRKKKLNSI